eukprot:CAMPEP_0117430552 /NCGR_PEP_ID=MMETSP0758-20121206/10099_1 /TAXON_ID=63605 /ORGANISM="Percolomonas cosmopolitus, Strain AE-1 (ATCC 50343)" /LENGTH=261 /DNA_ID=CAMNT_0005218701 /DNA_START=21 /DNA_END=804 /DNA_ORIENTATION=-
MSILSSEATLKVKILEARNLRASDSNGLSDPYCVVQLRSKKFKTKVKHKTLSPVWGDLFTLKVKDPKTDILKIQVRDEDKFSKDDALGELSFRVNQMVKNKEEKGWYRLQNTEKGEIRLALLPLDLEEINHYQNNNNINNTITTNNTIITNNNHNITINHNNHNNIINHNHKHTINHTSKQLDIHNNNHNTINNNHNTNNNNMHKELIIICNNNHNTNHNTIHNHNNIINHNSINNNNHNNIQVNPLQDNPSRHIINNYYI